MEFTSTVLEVENLRKVFFEKNFFGNKINEFVAVDNISFHLNKGEILGLLGPNGAGKTTTIQMLLGLMTPTKGKITYFGKNFLTNKKEILNQITFASSYVQLPGALTVYENLDIFGRLYGLNNKERDENIKYLLEQFGILDLRYKPTGVLSAGQMTLVMLAKAFLPSPSIVLLDEPTAALDPETALEVRNFILNQQENYGVSILLTSHNMEEVTEMCDRILVLKEGKIIANNSPDQLAKSVSISRIHLYFDNEKLMLAEDFLKMKKSIYSINGNLIKIDIDESEIPFLLYDLALAGLKYSKITIDDPNLEDYFLSISRKINKF